MSSQPILLGIGANLPGADGASPLEMCRRAAIALDRLPTLGLGKMGSGKLGLANLRLRGLSRWFRSAPIPASDQPDFINGVAHLEGTADPAALLAALHELEDAAGRARGVPNAARVLDLDIIAMGDLVRPAPDPVLPHPRAHLRAFVLLPLLDVAPSWVHPVLGQGARELLAALPAQDISPI